MKEQIEKIVADFCTTYRIPGLALQVAKNGEVMLEAYEGYRDVESKLPINAHTVFGVASITKSFTTLAIMMLQEAGKLHIDDEVKAWIPTLEKIQTGTKIHHLMTHTAGYKGLTAFHRARLQSMLEDKDSAMLFNLPINKALANVVTVEDMIAVMNEEVDSFIGIPGEKFNYSNESYALLQYICEKASGTKYTTFVRSHILEPLGMNRTFFTVDEMNEKENITEIYAYTKDKARQVFHSPTWWASGEIYSAGALKSSIQNIMRYLEIFQNGGTVDGKQFLNEESMKQMMQTEIKSPHGVHYGYGLLNYNIYGETLVGHGGGIKGVSSFMGIVKSAGLTIAVLTNIAEVPTELLVKKTVAEILQLSPNDEEPKMISTYEHIIKYEGMYDSGEGQKIAVCIENNRLYLRVQHEYIATTQVAHNLFRLPDEKYIAFETDRSGRVCGMYRGMRYYSKQSV